LAEKIHTIPSNLPDIISLPVSLSVAVAVDAGEVRSAGGATASGRLWRNGRREVDEPSSRDLFCFIADDLSFLYAAPPSPPSSLQITGEDSTCSIEEDDPYRFGC
jgi:hypothetical protein